MPSEAASGGGYPGVRKPKKRAAKKPKRRASPPPRTDVQTERPGHGGRRKATPPKKHTTSGSADKGATPADPVRVKRKGKGKSGTRTFENVAAYRQYQDRLERKRELRRQARKRATARKLGVREDASAEERKFARERLVTKRAGLDKAKRAKVEREIDRAGDRAVKRAEKRIEGEGKRLQRQHRQARRTDQPGEGTRAERGVKAAHERRRREREADIVRREREERRGGGVVQLLENAKDELRDTVTGAPAAAKELAGVAGEQVKARVEQVKGTGRRTRTPKTDRLVKDFKETSPAYALAQGDVKEALGRAKERPLAAIGEASVVAGAGGAAARTVTATTRAARKGTSVRGELRQARTAARARPALEVRDTPRKRAKGRKARKEVRREAAEARTRAKAQARTGEEQPTGQRVKRRTYARNAAVRTAQKGADRARAAAGIDPNVAGKRRTRRARKRQFDSDVRNIQAAGIRREESADALAHRVTKRMKPRERAAVELLMNARVRDGNELADLRAVRRTIADSRPNEHTQANLRLLDELIDDAQRNGVKATIRSERVRGAARELAQRSRDTDARQAKHGYAEAGRLEFVANLQGPLARGEVRKRGEREDTPSPDKRGLKRDLMAEAGAGTVVMAERAGGGPTPSRRRAPKDTPRSTGSAQPAKAARATPDARGKLERELRDLEAQVKRDRRALRDMREAGVPKARQGQLAAKIAEAADRAETVEMQLKALGPKTNRPAHEAFVGGDTRQSVQDAEPGKMPAGQEPEVGKAAVRRARKAEERKAEKVEGTVVGEGRDEMSDILALEDAEARARGRRPQPIEDWKETWLRIRELIDEDEQRAMGYDPKGSLEANYERYVNRWHRDNPDGPRRLGAAYLEGERSSGRPLPGQAVAQAVARIAAGDAPGQGSVADVIDTPGAQFVWASGPNKGKGVHPDDLRDAAPGWQRPGFLRGTRREVGDDRTLRRPESGEGYELDDLLGPLGERARDDLLQRERRMTFAELHDAVVQRHAAAGPMSYESAVVHAKALSRDSGVEHVPLQTGDEFVVIPDYLARRVTGQLEGDGRIMRFGRWGTRQFIRAALPFSISWHAGNIVDLYTRLALTTPPGSVADGKAVHRALEQQLQELDPDLRGLVLDSLKGHFGARRTVRDPRLADVLRETRIEPVGKVTNAIGDFLKATGGRIVDKAFDISSDLEGHAVSRAIGVQAKQYARDLGIAVKDHREAMAQLARELEADPYKVHELQDRVLEVVGDFATRSPLDRRMVAGIDPFWKWLRASTRFVLRTLPEQHPKRTALMFIAASMTADERAKSGLNYYWDEDTLERLHINLGYRRRREGFLAGALGGDQVMPTVPLTSFGEVAGILGDPARLAGRPLSIVQRPAAALAGYYRTPGELAVRAAPGGGRVSDLRHYGDRETRAGNMVAETFVPTLRQARVIREKGGTPKPDSTVLEPGSHGGKTYASGLDAVLNPAHRVPDRQRPTSAEDLRQREPAVKIGERFPVEMPDGRILWVERTH